MSRALLVDVDGVVAAVHRVVAAVRGHSAWGDDVEAGNVFGPVYVSPEMCARLDELAQVPDLSCWWLTSWTPEMRARMDPFPGRDWPAVADELASRGPGGGRRWWKLEAVESWLDRHGEVTGIAWCDDHLRAGARAASVRRRLAARGVDVLLVAPNTAAGLTPGDLATLSSWAHSPGAATAIAG